MKIILFVCTGNTCRSPMAQCLMNDLCKKLGNSELCAVSAGICAQEGVAASWGANNAMLSRGLSLQGHQARKLTEEILRGAFLVVGMSQGHIDAVNAAFPNVRVPLLAFDPPIPDPFCGDAALYEQTAQALQKQVCALYKANVHS